ncbi:MAG: hypothetical protein OXL37_18795 [Chloroflexota bacterium]|nr:hypothetical protein [Chloroflexota bacterium]MDE2959966.1 hypothetical protein [Chloroflexota bacterium]
MLRDAETIVPADEIATGHYGTLGTAIDYRLRYCFAVTPYRELAAWKGAVRVSGEPIPWTIVVSDEEWVRLDNLIRWEDLGIPLSLPKIAIEGFFQDLDKVISKLQPAGRKLNCDDEQLLNRYCIVLALFEQCFRRMPSPTWPLFQANVQSANDLLKLSPAQWIDDLCAMSEAFYDYFKDGLKRQAILNPNFDGSVLIGGADADIILEMFSGSWCLVDFKTTVNARIEGRWLHQLLGYCLLDFSNRYRIERVGFYLPRQARFIGWDLADLVKRLGAEQHLPLAKLRSEFCEIVESLPSVSTAIQSAAQS